MGALSLFRERHDAFLADRYVEVVMGGVWITAIHTPLQDPSYPSRVINGRLGVNMTEVTAAYSVLAPVAGLLPSSRRMYHTHRFRT